MAESVMAFPLLPGKRDALAEFAGALMGARRDEYIQSQASVLRESWYLQPTPQGDLVIMVLTAPDPLAVFAGLAVSAEPFDAWFRAQVQDLTGLDLSQPPPGLPPRVFHWERS